MAPTCAPCPWRVTAARAPCAPAPEHIQRQPHRPPSWPRWPIMAGPCRLRTPLYRGCGVRCIHHGAATRPGRLRESGPSRGLGSSPRRLRALGGADRTRHQPITRLPASHALLAGYFVRLWPIAVLRQAARAARCSGQAGSKALFHEAQEATNAAGFGDRRRTRRKPRDATAPLGRLGCHPGRPAPGRPRPAHRGRPGCRRGHPLRRPSDRRRGRADRRGRERGPLRHQDHDPVHPVARHGGVVRPGKGPDRSGQPVGDGDGVVADQRGPGRRCRHPSLRL